MTEAWQYKMASSNIKKCFVRSGFKSNAEYDDGDEFSCLPDLREKWQHLKDVNYGKEYRVV